MREEFAIIKLPEHVKLPDNDSTLLKAKVYPGGNYLMNNMSKHERAGGTSKMLEQ